ncbi:MAG: hypothetical protein JRG96_06555 [Deltaproteobacteria bacterium]|nr:hypothetical protein [Deltaproteobacteria bacterium]
MWRFGYWLSFALASAWVFARPGAAEVAGSNASSNAESTSFVRHEAPAPSSAETYCAWFADRDGDVIYFGQAAFWWGFRSSDGADPARDFALEGPRPIGRFDLGREAFLPSLDAGAPGARSGVWDVLRHANGRIYFTTFFERGGYVDPANERVVHFGDAGTGLNELAPGPGGAVLATRYADAEGGAGSLVLLDSEGGILAEHVLVSSTPGFQLAAKSAALDPIRGDIWVNSDLLPARDHAGEKSARGPGGSWGAAGHPTLVMDAAGRERARFDAVEIQAMAFGADGVGYLALAEGARLSVAVLTPGLREGDPRRGLELARRVVVDDNYSRHLDFAQTLAVDDQGRVILTRWGGHVHVLERERAGVQSGPGGEGAEAEAITLRSLRLPAYEPGGLYYAAYLAGDRICATYCGRVSVVCGSASALAPGPAAPQPSAGKRLETPRRSDSGRERLR